MSRLHTTLKTYREVTKDVRDVILDKSINSTEQFLSETDLRNNIDFNSLKSSNDNRKNEIRNVPMTGIVENEKRIAEESIENTLQNLRKNMRTLKKNLPEQRTFHEEGAIGVWSSPTVSQVGLEYNPCSEDYAVGK